VVLFLTRLGDVDICIRCPAVVKSNPHDLVRLVSNVHLRIGFQAHLAIKYRGISSGFPYADMIAVGFVGCKGIYGEDEIGA
jgi:hypothetical protein